jgi:TolB protein
VTVASAGIAGCGERTPSQPTPSALAVPGPAVALKFAVEPTNGSASASLAPIAVAALDEHGARATGFTGTVTLAIDVNPSGATLSGDTSVDAVAGVASFSTVRISDSGSGVKLRATASGLTAAVSKPFDVSWPDMSQAVGRIAFVSDRDGSRQLYVMNADGSGLTRLTRDSASYSRPVWSPDNSKIAFARGGQGIFMMNADGSGMTRVSAEGRDPAWSPDGSRIRFVRSVADAPTAIEEVALDGSRGIGPVEGNFGSRLAFSPDLRTVAFDVSTFDSGDGFTQVYLMNADGTDFRRLSSPFDPMQSAEGSPAWSPDGKLVAFWSFWFGIATMGTDGSARATSVFRDFPDVNFSTSISWSPDGQYIAFVRGDPNAGREIWVAFAAENTPRVRRITPRGMNAWDPGWSRRATP